MRRLANRAPSYTADHSYDGVLFSLMDDFVWVTWPDSVVRVRLGTREAVVTMMHDFLAQERVAQRLTNRRDG